MSKTDSGIEKVFQTAKKVKDDKDTYSKNHEPNVAWNNSKNKKTNTNNNNTTNQSNITDISSLTNLKDISKEIKLYNFKTKNNQSKENSTIKKTTFEIYKGSISDIKNISEKLNINQVELIRYMIDSTINQIKEKL